MTSFKFFKRFAQLEINYFPASNHKLTFMTGMDRGKAKMTEDVMAAELRVQQRHSQTVVGQGLYLQPSLERGLPTPNNNFEPMAQQFLDDRYITSTENAWSMFSDSSPYPPPPNSMLQGMEHLSTSAPRTVQDIRSDLFGGLRDVASQNVIPCDVQASVSSPTNIVFQTADVTPCSVQASSNMPASSVSPQMGHLSETPQPLPVDDDQLFQMEPRIVDEIFDVIGNLELMNIRKIQNYLEASSQVTCICKASLGQFVDTLSTYVCEYCESWVSNSQGEYVCNFCGKVPNALPKNFSRVELFDNTGKIIVLIHPKHMYYFSGYISDDPLLFRIGIQNVEDITIAVVAKFLKEL